MHFQSINFIFNHNNDNNNNTNNNINNQNKDNDFPENAYPVGFEILQYVLINGHVVTTLETEIELGLYMTLMLLTDIVPASLARSVRAEVIILGSSRYTMKAVFDSREGGKAATIYCWYVKG